MRSIRLTQISLALAALAVVAIAAAPSANAQTPGITLTQSGSIGNSAFTRGWRFTIDAPITVTSLGWYDNGQDGLVNSHPVGIWTTGGTLLLSATVQSGTADPLTNFFRFNSSLTGSSVLPAGTYDVGGLSTNADIVTYALSSAQAITAPEVTFVQNASNGTAGVFSAPSTTQADLDRGLFGANFQFTASAAAPEPGSVALLALAGVPVVGLIRRKRK